MDSILKQIDVEIEKLQQIKTILNGDVKPVQTEEIHLVRRNKMSPDGRARIAAAARLRWKKARQAAKAA